MTGASGVAKVRCYACVVIDERTGGDGDDGSGDGARADGGDGPRFPVAPGPGRADCAHRDRLEGVCVACGHCEHDVVLNGACLACGSTALDPVARSPRPELISADRLRRR